MALNLKKPARKLYYRRRHLSLFANDALKSRRAKQILMVLLLQKQIGKLTNDQSLRLDNLIRSLSVYYLSLVVEPDEPIERPLRMDRTIDSFSLSDCQIFFRFGRQEMRRLFAAFAFTEDVITLDNRGSISSEEVFLRGMYEMAGGETQHKISALFGRDGSTQSRAFKWFIDFVYSSKHHLVHDNLEWWFRNGFFKTSAEAIHHKMGDIELQMDGQAIAHFIDCNCMPTSVTGGGPAEAGANAARWDDTVQRAFYNGWKSVHGLKHQTVNNAYGFTVDMCGPTSLRRNDLYVLGKSEVNERMRLLQLNQLLQYIIFGDSAYKRLSHILSYLNAGDELIGYLQWNLAVKRVRISIEWDYGQTASLFKYVQNKSKLKILKSSYVSQIYTVATILRNCHIALYGCQTSLYFGLIIPHNFLEHYLAQTDM